MLRNASRFALNYMGISNRVKESGFAVIHMAENGDNRWAWPQVGRVFVGDEPPV
jgi:hypothetical protein